MPKTVVRNNDYYLNVIERDHPRVWADYCAGKFKSVSDARRAAGLLSERTPLHELKNAWRKASPSERRAFTFWLRTIRPVSTSCFAANGAITPGGAKRVEHIFKARGIGFVDLMDEIGFSRRDTSLQMSIRRSTGLRPDLVAALEKWLTGNAAY